MTADEAISGFTEYLRAERRASEHTVAAYATDLALLVAHLADKNGGEAPAVEAIDVYALRGWLGGLARTHAPTSIARKIAAARSWMKWMNRRGILARNPGDELAKPRLGKGLPAFLNVDAAQQVMEAASDDSPEGLRDHAILETLYGSGLRVSELVGLDLADVDLDAASARVRGKGNKERLVPLGRPCVQALRAYLASRAALPRAGCPADPRAVFLGRKGKRLDRRTIHGIVQRYGALGAGRSDLHPHALRHSCATHMLDGGADLRSIQQLLGHARLTVTQKYTHVSVEQLLRVYDSAHPLARARR